MTTIEKTIQIGDLLIFKIGSKKEGEELKLVTNVRNGAVYFGNGPYYGSVKELLNFEKEGELEIQRVRDFK